MNPRDVLLRIDTVGVCGSDIHYYTTGRIGTQVVQFPERVGHECAGTVIEVGSEVTGLRVGQRVAVDPLVACGHCDQCRSGRRHTCRQQRFVGNPGEAPGGQLLIIGIPDLDRVSLSIHTLRRKEIQLLNVRRQNHCTASAVEMIAGGKVNMEPLVTHHFSLPKSKEAFDLVDGYRDGVVKAIIHVSG